METAIVSIQTALGYAMTLLVRGNAVDFIAAGWLVLGSIAWAVAASRGWPALRQIFAVLSAGGLAIALTLTLFNRIARSVWGSGEAAVFATARCEMGSRLLSVDPEALLNWLLLVPFALFLVLATRRPIASALATAALSCAIEGAQILLGLGACQAADIIRNTAGGVAAALLAAALLAVPTVLRALAATASRTRR